ncbi:MAG: nucleotidyltransferase family protein [Anaerolineales bacterium]
MGEKKQRHGSTVAGIVLAAGDSERFPEPKQLLHWKGKALVWHAVRAALEGGLEPVVVVTGADADDVRAVLAEESVEFVHNPDWVSGQSTSMHAGLDAVRDAAEAVVMLLSDMPLVDAKLIRALVSAHRESHAAIVAPRAKGRRGNPVLFTRATYPELDAVEGDRGGRKLIGSLFTEWVDWDDSALQDIDYDEDWERLRGEG